MNNDDVDRKNHQTQYGGNSFKKRTLINVDESHMDLVKISLKQHLEPHRHDLVLFIINRVTTNFPKTSEQAFGDKTKL